LQRELLLREGDVFDEEFLHESVSRINRSGLVDPVDPEKDVDFSTAESKQGKSMNKRSTPINEEAPLLDLIIHVKRASRF
jgi:hypothetical protein